VTGPTEVTLFKWEGAALHLAATIRLQHPIAADRPFTLLPVGRDTLFPPPDAGFIIVRDEFADVYRIDASLSAACVCSLGIGGFGEVHVGARGKFLAGDVNDLWLAEPRWKDASGATVGRLALLSATRFSTLGTGAASASSVEDVASAVIVGSARYTDYDGIGSTLSPYAGHVLGERAVPDLTFSGHRHMNEFGAVFICPGRLITEGARLSADHSEIVKIVGRPISQLAPPFVHLDVEDLNGDGHDELVVAADNDLCAGLNSGAIYVLDGKAIKDAWTGR